MTSGAPTDEGAEPARGADLGVVLCGGASRRMGGDKARLVVGGETLLARAARALRGVAREVVLATGRDARYPELGLARLVDPVPDAGPLGGLAAGLEALAERGGTWLCLLACDMPRADARAFAALLERARADGLDACLLETEGGVEPLFAAYSSRCLAPVRAALARGDRRMIAFHDAVRVGTVGARALGLADPARNLNTAEDLRAELASGERVEAAR